MRLFSNCLCKEKFNFNFEFYFHQRSTSTSSQSDQTFFLSQDIQNLQSRLELYEIQQENARSEVQDDINFESIEKILLSPNILPSTLAAEISADRKREIQDLYLKMKLAFYSNFLKGSLLEKII